MFVVYVLHSEVFDKIYIGFTSNIEKRLLSHFESNLNYKKRFSNGEPFFLTAFPLLRE
ncbi:MAG: GIY-YIG nuclease family protein [Chitinophagales bacterium]